MPDASPADAASHGRDRVPKHMHSIPPPPTLSLEARLAMKSKPSGVALPVTTGGRAKKCRQHVNPLSDFYSVPLDIDASWFAEEFADPTLPLTIDIGSAFGGWCLEAATANRGTRNFIGLEIRHTAADTSQQRRDELGLVNCSFLRANANIDLDVVLAAARAAHAPVERILLQFPDPWFKKKHRKRRVITPGLAASIARALANSTAVEPLLYLSSDYLPVAAQMRHVFQTEGTWLGFNPLEAATEREKAVLKGLGATSTVNGACFRACFRPVDPDDVPTFAEDVSDDWNSMTAGLRQRKADKKAASRRPFDGEFHDDDLDFEDENKSQMQMRKFCMVLVAALLALLTVGAYQAYLYLHPQPVSCSLELVRPQKFKIDVSDFFAPRVSASLSLVLTVNNGNMLRSMLLEQCKVTAYDEATGVKLGSAMQNSLVVSPFSTTKVTVALNSLGGNLPPPEQRAMAATFLAKLPLVLTLVATASSRIPTKGSTPAQVSTNSTKRVDLSSLTKEPFFQRAYAPPAPEAEPTPGPASAAEA